MGDLVLHREHISDVAVVSLTPHECAVGRRSEVHYDPQPIAIALNGSGQHGRDAELFADRVRIPLPSGERASSSRAEYAEPGFPECMGHLQGKPFAEIV